MIKTAVKMGMFLTLAWSGMAATLSTDCRNGLVETEGATGCTILASSPATNVNVSAALANAVSGITGVSNLMVVVAGNAADANVTFATVAKRRKAYQLSGSVFASPGAHYTVTIRVGSTVLVMTETNGVVPTNQLLIAEKNQVIAFSSTISSDAGAVDALGSANLYFTPLN